MNQLDLNNPPPNHHLQVSVKPEETNGERHVRMFKDLALFMTALVAVIFIGKYCYDTITSAAASPEEKKWAMSILSAIVGGLIGYLIRK